MFDLAANAAVFLAVIVLGLGVILAVIATIAWSRMHSRRTLLIAMGFVVLAVKGAFLTAKAWTDTGATAWLVPVGALDVVFALLMYGALRTP